MPNKITINGNKWFGAHVSAQGGVHQAAQRASEIGAEAFALFVKNQRQWKAPKLEPSIAQAFQSETFGTFRFHPRAILPHAGYLINLGNPTPEAQTRSLQALCEEMERCKSLGIPQLNLHPGSSLGKISVARCLAQIASRLTEALHAVEGVDLILENTAGQGHNVGYLWEHLAEILGHMPQAEALRVGCCMDSCHAFAAGYDLTHEEGWGRTLEAFQQSLGFQKLKAMHLNDSKGGCGSRLDRHASLGEGLIGRDFFTYVAQSPYFVEIPLILETPDEDRWPQEIAWLRSQAFEVKR